MTSSRESGSRRIGARASTDNGEKVDLLEAAILMTATKIEAYYQVLPKDYEFNLIANCSFRAQTRPTCIVAKVGIITKWL